MQQVNLGIIGGGTVGGGVFQAVQRNGALMASRLGVRLDPDVLKFFRSQGKGYQTTINTLLRKYMEAQSKKSSGGD